MICGQALEFEVVPHGRAPGAPLVMRPTDWRQKPHSCPPGAAEKWAVSVRGRAPTEAHLAFRADLIELLKKHSGHLEAQAMLALSAHMVGQILAMQDQRKLTPAAAMEVVSANIEQGNREAIDKLCASSGKA